MRLRVIHDDAAQRAVTQHATHTEKIKTPRGDVGRNPLNSRGSQVSPSPRLEEHNCRDEANSHLEPKCRDHPLCREQNPDAKELANTTQFDAHGMNV